MQSYMLWQQEDRSIFMALINLLEIHKNILKAYYVVTRKTVALEVIS